MKQGGAFPSKQQQQATLLTEVRPVFLFAFLFSEHTCFSLFKTFVPTKKSKLTLFLRPPYNIAAAAAATASSSLLLPAKDFD